MTLSKNITSELDTSCPKNPCRSSPLKETSEKIIGKSGLAVFAQMKQMFDSQARHKTTIMKNVHLRRSCSTSRMTTSGVGQQQHEAVEQPAVPKSSQSSSGVARQQHQQVAVPSSTSRFNLCQFRESKQHLVVAGLRESKKQYSNACDIAEACKRGRESALVGNAADASVNPVTRIGQFDGLWSCIFNGLWRCQKTNLAVFSYLGSQNTLFKANMRGRSSSTSRLTTTSNAHQQKQQDVMPSSVGGHMVGTNFEV